MKSLSVSTFHNIRWLFLSNFDELCILQLAAFKEILAWLNYCMPLWVILSVHIASQFIVIIEIWLNKQFTFEDLICLKISQYLKLGNYTN